MNKHRYDKIGIISSILCVIHCAIIPILLTIVANMGDPFGAFSFPLHLIFIALAFTAVYFASKNSYSIKIKIALWSFFILFAAGIFLEQFTHIDNSLTLLSSIGLIVTHLINIRYCKKCETVAYKVENYK